MALVYNVSETVSPSIVKVLVMSEVAGHSSLGRIPAFYIIPFKVVITSIPEDGNRDHLLQFAHGFQFLKPI
jgi:hypothetical protein